MKLSQYYIYIQYKLNGELVTKKITSFKQIKILKMLINDGSRGVLTLGLPKAIISRWKEGVPKLREIFGLEILEKRERCKGIWGSRYILATDINILNKGDMK